MRRSATAVAVLAFIAGAGCGSGSEGKGAGRPGDNAGPGPSAPGENRRATGQEDAYEAALQALADKDFDGAVAGLESLGDYRDARVRLAAIRREAAAVKLAEARSKLPKAPQAAVAMGQTAQRYHSTAAGQAFLKRAREALRRFERREKAEQGGGPPPGSGPDKEGSGPPPGKGPRAKE